MALSGIFGRKPRTSAPSIPEGLATKCAGCATILFTRDFEKNLKVCPKCGHHHRLTAAERIELTLDEGSFKPLFEDIRSVDPLGFPDYADKHAKSAAKTGLSDAVLTGVGTLEGMPVYIGVAEFGFMGGSMGSVVGERLACLMEAGAVANAPVVIFSASGGARMQEGLYSLMQMAKTSAAAARLGQARAPFISVLTDPTTGGVYASYACLGDIILAEPGATVGFAGRRVGNQDMGVRLPDNFQTSEFQFEHGMVDRIVPRKEMRTVLAEIAGMLSGVKHSGR
jgi:acetyl-CoA carboxylase carboxyl transferase subunit beta